MASFNPSFRQVNSQSNTPDQPVSKPGERQEPLQRPDTKTALVELKVLQSKGSQPGSGVHKTTKQMNAGDSNESKKWTQSLRDLVSRAISNIRGSGNKEYSLVGIKSGSGKYEPTLAEKRAQIQNWREELAAKKAPPSPQEASKVEISDINARSPESLKNENEKAQKQKQLVINVKSRRIGEIREEIKKPGDHSELKRELAKLHLDVAIIKKDFPDLKSQVATAKATTPQVEAKAPLKPQFLMQQKERRESIGALQKERDAVLEELKKNGVDDPKQFEAQLNNAKTIIDIDKKAGKDTAYFEDLLVEQQKLMQQLSDINEKLKG